MGCRIPESKRQLIKAKIELKRPTKAINKETNVSIRAIQVFAKNLREYGTLRPPKLVPQGRPRLITPEMQEVYILHTALLLENR